jgi:nicotinate-nucleotide--dimethylbenzimidazole phosphoribosyltransferase
MAAARARGGGELAVWLVGVTGAQRPVVRVRRIDAAAALAPSASPPGPLAARAAATDPLAAEPSLTIAEVAHAVDTGRDLAAAAATEDITVLVASAPGADNLTAALSLTAALADGDARPLRSLRRLGTEEIAVLCGVALGAGERGLGCVCDGLAALAGAAVAGAIEPTLGARLRAVDAHEQAARLGIAAVDAHELAAALD